MVFEKMVAKIPFAVQEKERKKLQLLTATGVTNPVQVMYEGASPLKKAQPLASPSLKKGSLEYQQASPFLRGRNPTSNAFKEHVAKSPQSVASRASEPGSGFRL